MLLPVWKRCALTLLAVVASTFLRLTAAGAVDPGSQLIGCDQAEDERITVTVSSHLDPSCTYNTRGIEIVASNVVFDCQGAHIATTDRRTGILITAPTDQALSNIVVRNCHIEGFLNNIRVTREGFRDLAAGVEYEHAFSDIVIEDSTLLNSRGVGLFVDGYVTDVTIRRVHVEGASSAGIYLETGSKDNVVEHSEIVNNGYGENGPNGQFFDLGSTSVWFWGPGREGIAIDGSRNNQILNNYFSGNSAGAIFLYKNCGEFVNQRPERWFDRRYGAHDNLIESNTIVGEDIGVWIASRMGENTYPMDCSDPAYIEDGFERVVLDHAHDNVVRMNAFQNVTYGIRVEDDHSTIIDNEFTGDDPAQQAIIVGTRFRTPALGLPVDGTVITGNHSSIAGNRSPYRWIHGHQNTTFEGNESQDRLAGFCEGVQPPTTFFIFVIAAVAAEPPDPPMVDPPVLPPPQPLPPCPLSCASSVAVDDPSIVIRRLDTPPGDDTLTFDGRMIVPHPFAPPIDPTTFGVGIVISDSMGARGLDVLVPGGAYDAAAKAGWRTGHGTWKYVNRGDTPPAGITKITIKDLSKRVPGRVYVKVKGKRGSYPLDTANLPLTGLIVLDPPTAETGQCGAATFGGGTLTCTTDGGAVRCN